MAETYDKIFRQVAQRGNVLITGDAATAEINYTNTSLGTAQLSQKAVEFPKSAVDDAILNAADLMVRLIGLNPKSPYRKYFSGQTDVLINGQALPIISDTGKPIVGVLGTVIDSDNTQKKYKFVDYAKVENFENLTLAIDVYWYNTDNIHIWHTGNEVLAQVVVWSKADQRVLMGATPRGACPFPEDLIEGLVSGGLAYMFRNNFNRDQVNDWKNTFTASLSLIDKEWEIKLGQLDILE